MLYVNVKIIKESEHVSLMVMEIKRVHAVHKCPKWVLNNIYSFSVPLKHVHAQIKCVVIPLLIVLDI